MEIIFAKPFRKLLSEDGHSVVASATLLSVVTILDKSQLSESFVAYDTDLEYTIPDDVPLLMLLFLKPSKNNAKNIFATIRIHTEEKELLYQNQIGKVFNVVIENK